MYDFDLVVPDSLDAALVALGEDEAQILAGGQTLIPTLKSRLAAPSKLVSLRGISDLRGVERRGDMLVIKAMTSHASVARAASGFYPALAALAGNIGDPAVRNRGTIGGSLANNDPSACYPSAALASGAVIVTQSREISADDYFQGLFATSLEEGEIIREVRFPIPTSAAYVKFVQPASRFALTGVFVARFAQGVRVAVTGASESGVFRWRAAEDALNLNFSAAKVEHLACSPEGMISDLHGSAEYRANLTKILTLRAVDNMKS